MRIGLFLCGCRGVIDNVVDVKSLGNKYEGSQDIVFIKTYDALCSSNEQKDILAKAKEYDLDAVVMGGCSPKHYESMANTITFTRELESAGVNPSKLSYANLKEQVALPHSSDIAGANKKAKFVIDVAIDKIYSTADVEFEEITPVKSVLVIGAGLAGASSALQFANQGFDVHVVEKKAAIGGPQLRYGKAFPKQDCSPCMLTPVITEMSSHPNINVITMADVIDVAGRVGNYKALIRQTPRYVDIDKCTSCGACATACPVSMDNEYDYSLTQRKVAHIPFSEAIPRSYLIDDNKIDYCRDECQQPCMSSCPNEAIDLSQSATETEIEVGGVVVAVGAGLYKPTEFDYENSPNVVTLAEYERILAPNGIDDGNILLPSDKSTPKSIGFVHCVGSRDPKKNAYCSRYCCMATATAVMETHEKLPDTKIYMFYRDMYSIGKNGDKYINSVMELDNVEPIRAIPSREETSDDGITLRVKIGTGAVSVPVDMLVLANALVPNDQTEQIRTALDIDVDEDGFFRELNTTTGVVNTTDEGKMICGACVGPKIISESMSEGAAAASSLGNVLGVDKILHEVFVSKVDDDLCGGCGACVKTCMFHASSINKEDHIAEIDTMRCKGCGNCVTACPSGARDLLLFPNSYFKNAINTFSKYEPEGPKVLAILCNGCAYGGADQAGLSGFKYPANVVSLRVPCAGRVDTQHVLYAFENGFDGVMIGECHHGDCHFIVGNTDMERRINLFREVLRSRRIDDDRLRIEAISANEGKKYAETIQQFVTDLKEMEG